MQREPTTEDGSFCQKRGWVYDATPSMRCTCAAIGGDDSVRIESRLPVEGKERKGRTAVSAFLTSASVSSPMSSMSSLPESTTSGTTLAKMRTAIKMDARGSNPVHP